MAIIELPTNRLPLLIPIFGQLAAVVESATPGAYIEMQAETGDLSDDTTNE